MNANLLNDLYFSFLPVKLNITFSLNGDDYPTENSNNNNNITNSSVVVAAGLKKGLSEATC